MAEPNRQQLAEAMKMLSELDQALEEIERAEEHRDMVLSQIAATKGREFMAQVLGYVPEVEVLRDMRPESPPSQVARGDLVKSASNVKGGGKVDHVGESTA